MKGTVVKDPATGEQIRLMPGSKALELYEESRKPGGNKGTKQKPSYADLFVAHMRELDKNYRKEIGK